MPEMGGAMWLFGFFGDENQGIATGLQGEGRLRTMLSANLNEARDKTGIPCS